MLLQELEKLEVERIEWIQTHLRQYTTLRHETDMFNQSVSPPDPSQICAFLLPEVLLLFSGGGACGPAAAEGGPGKRPRAVGEGEQDRRGPTRGYGHLEPGLSALPLRSFGRCVLGSHLDSSSFQLENLQERFSPSAGKRRQTSMFPSSHDVITP